jgi:hypothetical protein
MAHLAGHSNEESRMRRPLAAAVVIGVLSAVCAGAAADAQAPVATEDDVLAAARGYVDASQQYLHHSKLRRGMKGYGLTVMSGTEVSRFGVEIVSVLENWGPHQDVILARLWGKDVGGVDIEKAGLVAGMSGSPVFVSDGGKDKIIGAVAFGWYAQQDAQCGIQPITQMIAVGGFLPGSRKGKPAGKDLTHAGPMRLPREFLSAVLDPRKRDFSRFGWPKRLLEPRAEAAGPRLVPLATPLTISGANRRTLAEASRCFAALGLVPVQSGGASGAAAEAAGEAVLSRGSGISIALITGDADWAAIGTCTEVTKDGRVLSFGHSFYAEGDVSLPIGPAYVHTVVRNLWGSFKLGATARLTGAASRDEYVGVAGKLGEKAPMIPMTVTAKWADRKRTQRYEFNILRHRWMTPALARILLMNVAWGWRELPEQNTVRYTVDVVFEKLGRYRAVNVSSQADIFDAASDLSRPLAALTNTSLGEPATVKRIDVAFEVEPVNRRAVIIDFSLDGRTYRPGETVTGKLVIREFRRPRSTIPVSFKLPDDLPEGAYNLSVSNYIAAISRLQSEMPQKFDPRTVKELFQAIQLVVQPRATTLYLHLPLPEGGLALGQRELPDLPPSKASVIAQAVPLETKSFSRSLVRQAGTDYVIVGSAGAQFVVRTEPERTLIRGGASAREESRSKANEKGTK